MIEQERRIEKKQKRNEEIEYTTDGENHKFKAKGDTAKGLAVAASAITGFVIGYILMRRY